MTRQGIRRLAAVSLVAVFSATTWTAQAVVQAPAAQPKDELFAGTEQFSKGARNVTEVNLDQRMLAVMDRFGANSVIEQKQLSVAKKMDLVAVRSYEYEKPDQYKLEDVEQFRRRLDGPEWAHIVKERGKDEQNDVWIRTDDATQVSELVMIRADAAELSFVHLKGHMPMQQLAAEAGAQYESPQIPSTTQKK